jgi:IS5 family transposase
MTFVWQDDVSRTEAVMQRINQSPTLIDGLAADLGGPKTEAFFAKIHLLFDFEALAAPLRDLFDDTPGQPGRPHWDVALMLKCLLLAKWFNLSDPQVEELLRDRISFRRFVGLSLIDATPDETTLCVFRRRLLEAGKLQALFDHTLTLLKAQGAVLQQGTIVDATIIDAPMGRQRPDGIHTHDPAATYTKNHGTLRHGYKAHIATDTRGLITDYVFDSAKVHDSRHIDPLTARETQAVYGDSAYSDKARRQRLTAAGIHAQIVHKRVRGQAALEPWQKRFNTTCSVVRAMVEHPRAWMHKMGFVMARYRGLTKNAIDFGLLAIAYNLKRALSILGHPLSTPRPHRWDKAPLRARLA